MFSFLLLKVRILCLSIASFYGTFADRLKKLVHFPHCIFLSLQREREGRGCCKRMKGVKEGGRGGDVNGVKKWGVGVVQ